MERYRKALAARRVVHLASLRLLPSLPAPSRTAMNLFELTRALVDIESITENEERVGEFLFGSSFRAGRALRRARRAHGSRAAPLQRAGAVGRRPVVTLSTHMDTVPPFFASREDDEFIWGRAACDTKGIIASMIMAAEALLEQGGRNFALLFVVGEERNSVGRLPCGEAPARVEISDQRRAHGKQAGPGFQGRVALRDRRPKAAWRTRRIRSWANRPSTNC